MRGHGQSKWSRVRTTVTNQSANGASFQSSVGLISAGLGDQNTREQ